MEHRDIFLNLSPLDHRYFLSNKELHAKLAQYLSEEATIRYCLKVEVALATALTEYFPGTKTEKSEIAAELASSLSKVMPEEVYKEEEKTQHNIRAMVNVLKSHLPEKVKPLIHMGATSVDILDTAFALRIKDAVRKVLLPLLVELEQMLASRTTQEAATPQVGRTHGQHAVPITFGFALAEYTSRLGKSILRIEEKSRNLRGKLAGAVGAYNATSMITDDPEKLEETVLASLGLSASEHSTQLVEPEYMLELLLEMNTCFGILANLADDLRNLQRSEINEVREEFGKDQVGSSTMPQKRNPWNSEHVKSLWKAFSPRVMTFFMDQISEHQRDLTNSASQRFIPEYIAGLCFAVKRMQTIMKGLRVLSDRMAEILSHTGDMVLSEAAYILLAMGGEPDGHEKVRKASLECEKTGKPLATVLQEDKKAWKTIKDQFAKVTKGDANEFFANPQAYTGIAARKARAIGEKYMQAMKKMQEVLS
ncbi:MAG: adenylosuccinate lyase [Spirochaetaceae bacterium]|nr:MAG: adenylosuccinate lyase [Spirochaetaceae bacterium]